MWICPTYGRPESLKRLIAVCERTAPDIDMVVRLHREDPKLSDYEKIELPEGWRKVVGPHQMCVGSLQHIYNLHPREKCYGFVADDIVTNTRGWHKILEEKAGGWAVAYPDDGIHGPKQCTHFCIGGKLVREVGWLGPEWLKHNFIDSTWYTIGYGIKRLEYCPEVEFEHLHFINDKALRDETYEISQAHYQEDKEAFEKWGQEKYEKLLFRLNKKVPCRKKTGYHEGETINVAIAIPSGGWCPPQFAISLADMCAHYSKFRVGKAAQQTVGFFSTRSSMLAHNRETLLKNVLRDEEKTHILWLDDDMTFPADTLHRLLLHGEDFVAAQGVTKAIPAEPTAKNMQGTRCFSDPHKVGIEEVMHVGLAVALMRITPELREMSRPRFQMRWNPALGADCGEDVFFCHRLKDELGWRLYVDHDLSRQIGHVGTLEYTHELVGEVKREAV